jgi:hypothetical protein
VVFRLKKDLPLHDGTGSLHLPTLAKCTCWSIVMSFISINWYLMGVAVVLYGFNICLDHFAGPLPHAFVSVFYPILYFAGFLLYTLQIFDFHSNIMLVMCALQISLVGDDSFWGRQLSMIPLFVLLIIEVAKRAANVANISTGGVDSVPVARTESDLESIGMLLYDTTHLSSLLLNVTLALLNKSVYLSVCLSVCLCLYVLTLSGISPRVHACFLVCLSGFQSFCLCLSHCPLNGSSPHPFLDGGPIGSTHLPDPDSIEALSESKALIEIHSLRSSRCFDLSIAALFILSAVVSIRLVQLNVRTSLFSILLANYFSSLIFAGISYGSFRCRRSFLSENTALIRFVNNRFSSGVDDEGTPLTVKSSYWSLIVGYIAAIFLTMVLVVTIYALDFTLTSKFGRLPRTSSKILYLILYVGGCLLGTSRILNMRTNFMFVVIMGLSLATLKLSLTSYLYVLEFVSISYLYRNYGPQEAVPPVISAEGTSNVPPVLVCDTGTGSIPATDNTCKEEVISGTTSVSTSTSTSSPSSGVSVRRGRFSANVCRDRSHMKSEGAYALLVTDESVHGPGDDRR